MSSISDLPAVVRRFVHDCITSATQLETLLLLAGTEPEDWDASEISAELRSNPTLIRTILLKLSEQGLLTETRRADREEENRYRFYPSSQTQRQTVIELEKACQERRHSVLAAIYSPHDP
jgi:transcription initiation factor IIE alpha subunit